MRGCLQWSHRKGIAEGNKFDLNDPLPVPDEEDEETLAAMDEGLQDAETGRSVPIEEVRELLPQSKFSTAAVG